MTSAFKILLAAGVFAASSLPALACSGTDCPQNIWSSLPKVESLSLGEDLESAAGSLRDAGWTSANGLTSWQHGAKTLDLNFGAAGLSGAEERGAFAGTADDIYAYCRVKVGGDVKGVGANGAGCNKVIADGETGSAGAWHFEVIETDAGKSIFHEGLSITLDVLKLGAEK